LTADESVLPWDLLVELDSTRRHALGALERAAPSFISNSSRGSLHGGELAEPLHNHFNWSSAHGAFPGDAIGA